MHGGEQSDAFEPIYPRSPGSLCSRPGSALLAFPPPEGEDKVYLIIRDRIGHNPSVDRLQPSTNPALDTPVKLRRPGHLPVLGHFMPHTEKA